MWTAKLLRAAGLRRKTLLRWIPWLLRETGLGWESLLGLLICGLGWVALLLRKTLLESWSRLGRIARLLRAKLAGVSLLRVSRLPRKSQAN